MVMGISFPGHGEKLCYLQKWIQAPSSVRCKAVSVGAKVSAAWQYDFLGFTLLLFPDNKNDLIYDNV